MFNDAEIILYISVCYMWSICGMMLKVDIVKQPRCTPQVPYGFPWD
jgi:hypothetical protein